MITGATCCAPLRPAGGVVQEAGIDMGGLMKEFLESVVAAGFDPNRGLFTATPDGYAYPNPLAGLACLLLGGLAQPRRRTTARPVLLGRHRTRLLLLPPLLLYRAAGWRAVGPGDAGPGAWAGAVRGRAAGLPPGSLLRQQAAGASGGRAW